MGTRTDAGNAFKVETNGEGEWVVAVQPRVALLPFYSVDRSFFTLKLTEPFVVRVPLVELLTRP